MADRSPMSDDDPIHDFLAKVRHDLRTLLSLSADLDIVAMRT